MSSTTIGNQIFAGCAKAINDFIIVPLYTVAIVAFLVFANLFFITLCTWIGFIFGYYGAKIISEELLLGSEHLEVYSIFGIAGTGTGIIIAIHVLPYTKSYFWFPLFISVTTTFIQFYLLFYFQSIEFFLFIFGGISPCLLCLFYWTTLEKDCHTLKATLSDAHYIATNP